MPVVAGILLDHVGEDPSERDTTLSAPCRMAPSESATGLAQLCDDDLPRLLDALCPQLAEVLTRVLKGAVPLGVGIVLPIEARPRLADGGARHNLFEPVVLDPSEVFEQACKCHRRGREVLTQLDVGEPATLPFEGRSLIIEKAGERGRLVSLERRFGPDSAVLFDLAHQATLTHRGLPASCIPVDGATATPTARRRGGSTRVVSLAVNPVGVRS